MSDQGNSLYQQISLSILITCLLDCVCGYCSEKLHFNHLWINAGGRITFYMYHCFFSPPEYLLTVASFSNAGCQFLAEGAR